MSDQPMTMREKIARAICIVDEQNGGAPWDWYAGVKDGHDRYFEKADAVLDALDAAGWAVTRKPTPMQEQLSEYDQKATNA